ncbi:restriction endonuclease [Noumeavirus]|uniref:restriction endonuclease n=1 Tax=Noumeavirus TaxID=1955558 RepID=UPI000982C13F|nr:restriction endonuclease [Noumeavirus]AQM73093.1 restriction endonuclease [Noumeavirus]
MNCETRTRGKLCGREECKPCFERSFASCDKAKYLAEGQDIPLLIAKNSHKKLKFDCPKCAHVFEASLANVSNGYFCPFCSSPPKNLCSSAECKTCFEKSFASSDKVEFWSFEKNKQSPRDVFASSGKKYWFECGKCKHSFEMGLNSASNGQFCPFCPNQKLCSLAECKICFGKSFASSDKVEFWDIEKNEQTPREVFMNSGKKFWFGCEKKHKFLSVLNKVSSGRWCPKCKHKTEAKLFSFLEKQFENPVHQFKVSWCKNPEKNTFLPFDFCVSKTIIELDGVQHYGQVSNWKSPEETQKNDRYKEEQALKNGYSVIRILQEDVWNDRIDWKSLLLEHIRDYETPVVKNLWEDSQNPQE